MSKHTPGPWTVQLPADDSAGIRVVDKRALTYANHRIADLQYWSTSQERGPDRDGAIANAYLIAAAPDLLAACYAVLHDCDDIDMVESNEPGREKGPWQMLNEAISKAVGS